MTRADVLARIDDELRSLARGVPGIVQVLLATRDGHPVRVHGVDDDRSLSTSAMIAALLGIGDRLAALTGDADMLEALVRSGDGTVVVYAAGDRAVLTVLTDATVNLARLHLSARLAVDVLAEHVEVLHTEELVA